MLSKIASVTATGHGTFTYRETEKASNYVGRSKEKAKDCNKEELVELLTEFIRIKSDREDILEQIQKSYFS
jgi:hypothetical protein